MTKTPCTEKPSPVAADRPGPRARLNELLHGRGWAPDVHVMDALRLQKASPSVPMLPDWAGIDTDWTYEPSVRDGDKNLVLPTLLALDEDQPDRVQVTYPYLAGQEEGSWGRGLWAPVLAFPLTHHGLDVLEELLPAIESYRADAQELTACLANPDGSRSPQPVSA